MIYSDALSAWWEKESQDHIVRRWPQWVNRFINAVGTSRVGTMATRGGPPGNSPENGRGTDAFGFADWEYSINYHLSLSAVYPYGDPRRIFAQGNQEQLSYLMTECWNHCPPTPERINEDTAGWPAVTAKIVEAKGCVVPDCDFRSGRRQFRIDGKMNADGTEMRAAKLRKRDRKETVAQELVCHPLLKGAERVLLGLPPLPAPAAAAAAPAAAPAAARAAAPAAAPAAATAAAPTTGGTVTGGTGGRGGGKGKGRRSGPAAPRPRPPTAAEAQRVLINSVLSE